MGLKPREWDPPRGPPWIEYLPVNAGHGNPPIPGRQFAETQPRVIISNTSPGNDKEGVAESVSWQHHAAQRATGANMWQDILKAGSVPGNCRASIHGACAVIGDGPAGSPEEESSLGHPARNSPCHVQTRFRDPSCFSTAPSYSGPIPWGLASFLPRPHRFPIAVGVP